MMRAFVLEYHDVIADGDFDGSGFALPGSASYKISAADFDSHLDAIARRFAGTAMSIGVDVASAVAARLPRSALFTFDDGGYTALDTARRLEQRGWRGHFFVATDYIGRPGFLDAAGLRDLHARGHVVGSHSCSHPLRMAALSDAQLADEWRRSCDALSRLLGVPTATASVPGGLFSMRVAEAARDAGITFLFTSEPRSTVRALGSCHLIGRYTIRRTHRSEVAVRLLGRWPAARLRQWTAWEAKKLAKRVGGRGYLHARNFLLRHQ